MNDRERQLLVALLNASIAADEAAAADARAEVRRIRRTLRESYRVRREVMPILRRKGLVLRNLPAMRE